MFDSGMTEISISSWSFPIVMVGKKDERHRSCVDFKKLNAVSKPLAVLVPLIDDILALAIDLKSGYLQVALDEADREKTAFACHMGLFKFRVMPSGLANVPGIFHYLMSIALSEIESFAMAYLDSISNI